VHSKDSWVPLVKMLEKLTWHNLGFEGWKLTACRGSRRSGEIERGESSRCRSGIPNGTRDSDDLWETLHQNAQKSWR